MSGTAEFQRIFDVSRETIDRLTALEALLRKWTAKINLVSRSTLDDVWGRHFIDSAQISRVLGQQPVRIADFGSGGGFPGLVVAILNKEMRPSSEVLLIESDLRKASFLSTAVRELGLNAKVIAERVEVAAPGRSDVVTARALAPLHALLPFADRHLTPTGRCFFLKGQSFRDEVDVARQAWDFDVNPYDSITQPGAALLEIQNLRFKK